MSRKQQDRSGRRSRARLGLIAALVGSMGAIAGCGDSDAMAPVLPGAAWPQLACDPIAPSRCGYPFPSNVFTRADPSTPTGRRVALSQELMPVDAFGDAIDPTPWNQLDGFSAGLAPTTQFEGVTLASLAGVASSTSIERSLADDSPTVLLDAQSGERVPHFVDLDMTGDDDDTRAFMIRPAVRLADGRRYIVAIRTIADASGRVIEASEAFAALRDGSESADPSVGERRALYADIFEHLSRAGVERGDLQIAWDYTTASRENNTGYLLHMRDEALAMYGAGGPSFEVTQVDEDFSEAIAYRIYGDMKVPLYLDSADPGAAMVFGPDGLPEPNAQASTATFEVEILIPKRALQEPAALLQFGHGLLGEKEQIESEHFLSFIDEYNYVLFGVDFIGFASADQLPVAASLTGRGFSSWAAVIERQHQGMLNSLLAMRMMKTTFAADPRFGGYVDPEQAYYLGISQGGIFGGTYMALTTDVARGVLGVMGMPYSLLLTRSVDFDIFFTILRPSFPDARDQAAILGLAQMLWDRTEPNGYAHYIVHDPLPGSPSHQVLMRAALGDHQVTTLGAHVMARSIGVPHVDTGLPEIFDLETVLAPHSGSGLVEYGFGLPADPVENLPQRACEDPHGKLRRLEPARRQLDTFLRTGLIENYCAAGICTFPDMSGCAR